MTMQLRFLGILQLLPAPLIFSLFALIFTRRGERTHRSRQPVSYANEWTRNHLAS